MTSTWNVNGSVREQLEAASREGRYALCNLRLSPALCANDLEPAAGTELAIADILVESGKLSAVVPAAAGVSFGDVHCIDADGRLLLPGFVDCHTHLDKGHISPRTPGADGSFAGAMSSTIADRITHWTADDLETRMDFALRCAHHYGTVAMRTHLDSESNQDSISWPVFEDLRAEWRGRIDLQAACLVGIDFARDEDALEAMAHRVATASGVLGAVAFMVPDIDPLLERMFAAARRHGLDLDFHADETADPSADALRRIAETKLRTRFEGKVLVGHCCSLARQEPQSIDQTLDKVAAAGLAVVSLPMCNLYLQDRRHDATTPRWRGVTLVHEMSKRGIPVALASDNTRDPFYAYGDLDMLETYRLGTRIMHLDHITGDWPLAVTKTPASVMRLKNAGSLVEGEGANFILFEGRSWSEVLSRTESDRIVVRAGVPLDTELPSYSELDAIPSLSPL